MSEIASSLTKIEVKRLGELEAIIRAGKETFIEVGQALLEIRDQRLYRSTFESFEEYCVARWQFKKRYALLVVSASKAALEVEDDSTAHHGAQSGPDDTENEVFPVNERQARELSKAPIGTRKAVMKEAVEQAIADGRSATAEDVKAVVQRVKAHASADTVPPPEPPASSDPEPWKSYNARIDTITGMLAQAKAELVELARLKGIEAAFVAWCVEKDWRKSMDNAIATLDSHRIIGAATKSERAKLNEDRPFLFAFDAGKKGGKRR